METDLQFKQAEFTSPSAANCQACGQPFQESYFGLNGQMICARCAENLQKEVSAARNDPNRYVRSMLFGGGVAAIGGAIYGAVMAYAHLELALISIAVGWAVGRAVRLGSGQIGGLFYQCLAAGLTYAAICGAYAFLLYQQMGFPSDQLDALIFSAYRLPFAGGTDNILGIIITGFGVFQAWQINQGGHLALTGPHSLSRTPPLTPTSEKSADAI